MKTRSILTVAAVMALMIAGVSCKKKLAEQYDDIVKRMMVDGSWIVTNFVEDSSDITSSFNGWICKFHDDYSLTATQSSGLGATTHTGTWQSNLSAQTISAQFSSSVSYPLDLLNGTWTIVSSSASKGKFSQTKSGKIYSMELTKY